MEIHLHLKRNKKKKYIRSVYNKEYNDGNHDESIYTIYLYTSHYIENINYDKSFSDEKNFGHPVYALSLIHIFNIF